MTLAFIKGHKDTRNPNFYFVYIAREITDIRQDGLREGRRVQGQGGRGGGGGRVESCLAM